jgi:putative ABC transport system permease protein
MKTTLFFDNIHIALASVKSNMLRTILTITIIAIGITALVGMLTAVSSIQNSITANFSNMGASTFNIQSRGSNITVGKKTMRQKSYSYISFKEAQQFKDEFTFPSIVSIHHRATGNATVKYESQKTNPNVTVTGIDENYLEVSGYSIKDGRNFTKTEVDYGRHVALIGKDVQKKLFQTNENPVDKTISIGGTRYLVAGVLEEKGSGFGGDSDNRVFLPVTHVRQNFSSASMTFNISVRTFDPKMVDAAITEATGLFRNIRGLSLDFEDNFNINKSDNFAKMLIENTAVVTLAATIIGLITLLGASIGLMNIMLVAVTERTSEIGVRKALGANKRAIRNQFLAESIVIGQLGGILGVVLGILVGNIVSVAMNSPFVIPWEWIILGLSICLIVSILSGLLPAIKAAKLDPIESLRYE